MEDDKKYGAAGEEPEFVLNLVRKKQPSVHDLPTRPYHEIPSMEDEHEAITHTSNPIPSPYDDAPATDRGVEMDFRRELINPALHELKTGIEREAHKEDGEFLQVSMLASVLQALNNVERNPASGIAESLFAEDNTLIHEPVVFALREFLHKMNDVVPQEDRIAGKKNDFSYIEQEIIREFREAITDMADDLGIKQRVALQLAELEEFQQTRSR